MSNSTSNYRRRKIRSRAIRNEAADIAFHRDAVIHEANGDEAISHKPMSYTKGLPHNYTTGLVNSEKDFDQFVKGIDSGDPDDFVKTPLGPNTTLSDPNPDPVDPASWKSNRGKNTCKVRAWESAGGGLTFDLEGADAQSVTMPPAPKLGSDELTAEIAEVYIQAYLRDVPFANFGDDPKLKKAVAALKKLSWFANGNRNGKALTVDNAFRGITNGDLIGPYLSQFLLIGNRGLNQSDFIPKEHSVSDGYISYGSIHIDQRVRKAKAELNYLTNWNEWYDVQNGANFGEQEMYDENTKRRFITTPRDLATFVHYDALYEAYLNACLILLGTQVEGDLKKYDLGVPFQDPDHVDHQQGFAHYGGPHILTLLTEVATRALKAVRYQKFNIHRRLRPEALAARMYKLSDLNGVLDAKTFANFESMHQKLDTAGIFDLVKEVNTDSNLLLPMAFVEGSPMHPSYGAGHATVAGACTTILKAFFNHELCLNIGEDKNDSSQYQFTLSNKPGSILFQSDPDEDGQWLKAMKDAPALTIEDELNKLAANISIGRDWAGVHYYSDYVQSLLLGEKIAISILEEQMVCYNHLEKFHLTLPKFDGSRIKIANGIIEDL